MNDSYSDEELEALPSTTTVFNTVPVELDKHVLVQRGYMVTDECPTHPPTSFSIPSGMTLIRKDNKYDLVPEGR